MNLRQLTPVIALFTLLTSSFVFASDVDEEKTVSVDGVVKIKVLRGKIRIEGWDEDKVRVQGDLDELATGLRFDVTTDRTEIEVNMPSGNVNWGDGSDLLIQVPSGNRVIIKAVSSEVFVEDLFAGAQIRTISGEIDVRKVHGNISVKSVSGQIHVEDSQGDLRISSASGEIAVRQHFGSADLESMSGEIDFDGGELHMLRSTTISGQIGVEAKFTDTVSAEVTSVSGQISLCINEPNNITIVANSMSGQIDNDLTDDQVRESFGQRSLDTKIGTGSGRVKLRAVSGAIELEEG